MMLLIITLSKTEVLSKKIKVTETLSPLRRCPKSNFRTVFFPQNYTGS